MRLAWARGKDVTGITPAAFTTLALGTAAGFRHFQTFTHCSRLWNCFPCRGLGFPDFFPAEPRLLARRAVVNRHDRAVKFPGWCFGVCATSCSAPAPGSPFSIDFERRWISLFQNWCRAGLDVRSAEHAGSPQPETGAWCARRAGSDHWHRMQDHLRLALSEMIAGLSDSAKRSEANENQALSAPGRIPRTISAVAGRPGA